MAKRNYRSPLKNNWRRALLRCIGTAVTAHSETPLAPDSSRIADKPAFTHAEIDSFLAKRFSLSPRAVFVSRAGEFAGRDSDSIISFERNNGVILGEYGFAYQGYRGSYEVEQGGSIHLHLMGRAAAWPPMKLVLDGADFWLYRADRSTGMPEGS